MTRMATEIKETSVVEKTSDEKKILNMLLEKHMTKLVGASESYDKAILSLSIAALGFIFAYQRFGDKLRQPEYLFLAVFFLCLSIVFILFSFLYQQFHSQHRIKYYFYRITNLVENESDKKLEHWADDDWLIWPIFSAVFLVVGIVLFALLVGNNI